MMAEPIICRVSDNRVIAWVPTHSMDIDPFEESSVTLLKALKCVISEVRVPCRFCGSLIVADASMCTDCQRDAYYT